MKFVPLLLLIGGCWLVAFGLSLILFPLMGLPGLVLSGVIGLSIFFFVTEVR